MKSYFHVFSSAHFHSLSWKAFVVLHSVVHLKSNRNSSEGSSKPVYDHKGVGVGGFLKLFDQPISRV